MTATRPVSRTARACPLLVLAGLPEAEEVRAALERSIGRPPHCATDLLDAVARVAFAPARDPISAILVAESVLDPTPEHVAACLRRVDPALRLILLSPEERQGEPVRTVGSEEQNVTTRAQGFDARLGLPIREDQARGALAEDVHQSDAAPARSGASPPHPEGRPPHADELDLDPAREAPTLDAPAPPDSPASGSPPPARPLEPAPAVTSTASGSASPPAPSRPVEIAAGPRAADAPPADPSIAGADEALLDAVLHGAPVLPIALEALRARTGWADLAFEPADERGPTEPDPTGAVRCGGRRYGRLLARQADRPRLDAWARWLGAWLHLEERHGSLREMAYTDELTRAGNRRAYDRFVNEEIELARRDRRLLPLMAFDIDDFKRYNDRFGHAAGDEVLREVVSLLDSIIRRGDRVFRIGGDEFVVVFADHDGPREEGSGPLESVEQLAGRFRRQVCELKLARLGPDAPGTLSISAGLATFPWDGHDAESLLEHADQLALESKRGGKNALTFGRGSRGRRSDDDGCA